MCGARQGAQNEERVFSTIRVMSAVPEKDVKYKERVHSMRRGCKVKKEGAQYEERCAVQGKSV